MDKQSNDELLKEFSKHWFFPGYGGIEVDKEGKHYRPIYFHFDDGVGLSKNQYSALVRPFWKILLDGKPTTPTVFIEHRDEDNYYVLGSFTYTTKRLLFFPGMNLRLANPPLEYLSKGKLDFYPEHMTLEDDLVSWHHSDLFKKTSNNRMGSFRTKKITEHLKLWFNWAVKPGVLEKLPNKQILYVMGNESEVERRFNIIEKSVEPQRLVTTQNDERIGGSHYWNFEFFVHEKPLDFDPALTIFPLHPVYYQYSPQIVKEDRKIAPTRIFPVKVPGFRGTIFIRYSKMKGSFPSDSLLGSGHERPDFKNHTI